MYCLQLAIKRRPPDREANTRYQSSADRHAVGCYTDGVKRMEQTPLIPWDYGHHLEPSSSKRGWQCVRSDNTGPHRARRYGRVRFILDSS